MKLQMASAARSRFAIGRLRGERRAKVRLILAAAAAFLAGMAVVPAAYATYVRGGWVFIADTANGCGFGRSTVDNTDKVAKARTQVVDSTISANCQPSGPVKAVVAGRIGASAYLDDNVTGYNCGHKGPIYNSTTTDNLVVVANLTVSSHCPSSAGHGYHGESGHLKWSINESVYYGTTSSSPSLNFN